MCSVRSFVTDDLFNFNHVNLDLLTETYNLPFYLRYLANWPEYFLSTQAPNGECMGYSTFPGPSGAPQQTTLSPLPSVLLLSLLL
mmetsp:Transcript_3122/g.7829  ORF Transcript_3122/g.7829 Transcript_3122/m.7829 type:complete len:85 (+) Transcript_3122:110-364(+)